MNDTLGGFEILVMAGLISAGGNAYGITIHDKLSDFMPGQA